MNQKPYDPRIVDRAVELWKRALANPVYQTTAPRDGAAHLSHTIFNKLIESSPRNNTPDVLDKFGEALKEIINTPSERGGYVYSLDVDYNPCPQLFQSAITAGLNITFPMKSSMYLNEDRVSFSMGYGNPTYYHYPISDNRWVVTTLRGSIDEEQALKEFIEQHGSTPFAKIEVAV